ncbi:MAG: carboxypeptidase-like regulatory domain-containing protein, partial [Planctomycetes bacterium]|nr:carboxypeptidase-like regulatory domain-containing protein [Planctomycetota bacterium]
LVPPEVRKLYLMPNYDLRQRVARVSENIELMLDPGALVEGVPQYGASKFVFNGLEDGAFTVLAQADRFHFSRIDSIEINAGDAVLKIDLTERLEFPGLTPGNKARLEGQVKIPEGARPQGIEVTILRRDLAEIRRWDPRGPAAREETGWEKTAADAQGRFCFDGLCPGDYVVAAAVWEWDVRLDAHQEIRIEAGANTISLEPKVLQDFGRFELIVTDRDGRPLPGICFLFLDPVDVPLGPRGSTTYFFYTNGTGKITIDNIPPGRYSFSLSRFEGREPLCEAQIEIGPGKNIAAEIALNEGSKEDEQ